MLPAVLCRATNMACDLWPISQPKVFNTFQ